MASERDPVELAEDVEGGVATSDPTRPVQTRILTSVL